MELKILGTGWVKCHQLRNNTRRAIEELGIKADIIEVTDINKILEYPIMTTPGLVIDEKVVVAGRVAGSAEIKKLIGEKLS